MDTQQIEADLERLRNDVPADWVAWWVLNSLDMGGTWCARPPWEQRTTVQVEQSADGPDTMQDALDEIWRQHRVHVDAGRKVLPQRRPCQIPERMSS